MLRSIGKQSGESVESVLTPGEEKDPFLLFGTDSGYGGKDSQKRKVFSQEWKSWGMMYDESGESMEPVEEVPLKELGESDLERLVRDWLREARCWFQRRREAKLLVWSMDCHRYDS